MCVSENFPVVEYFIVGLVIPAIAIEALTIGHNGCIAVLQHLTQLRSKVAHNIAGRWDIRSRNGNRPPVRVQFSTGTHFLNDIEDLV